MNGKLANDSGKFANYSEKANGINDREGSVAVPGRLELPTFGLGNRCSILLSYGTAPRVVPPHGDVLNGPARRSRHKASSKGAAGASSGHRAPPGGTAVWLDH